MATLVVLMAWAVALSAADRPPPLPGQIGLVVDGQLREISGLAVSRRDPDLLWVLNDSGNGARIYAIARSGERLATVAVLGARNRDWEDLTAATLEGRSTLIVGDIGDNEGRRPYVTLYLVPEPWVEEGRPTAAVKVERTIHFRYPDGPRDAEGLAFDPVAGELLVLSKRAVPPALYAVPVASDESSTSTVVTARKVAEVASLPPPSLIDLAADPRFGIYASQPTALDYVPSVGLLVMTYARPYLFDANLPATPAELLSAPPRPVVSARLKQAEAAVIDGEHLLLTSERLPSPLLRVPHGVRTRSSTAADDE
ncbi:MAG: hypothetical protein AAF184_04240 [Pseudomonadota bacterium]